MPSSTGAAPPAAQKPQPTSRLSGLLRQSRPHAPWTTGAICLPGCSLAWLTSPVFAGSVTAAAALLPDKQPGTSVPAVTGSSFSWLRTSTDLSWTDREGASRRGGCAACVSSFRITGWLGTSFSCGRAGRNMCSLLIKVKSQNWYPVTPAPFHPRTRISHQTKPTGQDSWSTLLP